MHNREPNYGDYHIGVNILTGHIGIFHAQCTGGYPSDIIENFGSGAPVHDVMVAARRHHLNEHVRKQQS